MNVQLDSTTYHFQCKPVGAPDKKRQHTLREIYRPDNLSFDIHATSEGRVSVRNISVSGFRVNKDGLSEHRLYERFYALNNAPEWAIEIIAPVLDVYAKAHG